MGDLIQFPTRRAERARPSHPHDLPPAFFFDVSCPQSYLSAEHVERMLGQVDWVAVDGNALRDRSAGQAAARARAEARARQLRLPLIWPDRYPESAPCALRAAAYACEIGAGAPFALAATRLAFCGGFDLDDPETLAEAAAAAGVPLEGALEAAGETWRDEELASTARTLRARGIMELPAVYAGGRWFAGDSGLVAAAAMAFEPSRAQRPLAPVG